MRRASQINARLPRLVAILGAALSVTAAGLDVSQGKAQIARRLTFPVAVSMSAGIPRTQTGSAPVPIAVSHVPVLPTFLLPSPAASLVYDRRKAGTVRESVIGSREEFGPAHGPWTSPSVHHAALSQSYDGAKPLVVADRLAGSQTTTRDLASGKLVRGVSLARRLAPGRPGLLSSLADDDLEKLFGSDFMSIDLLGTAAPQATAGITVHIPMDAVWSIWFHNLRRSIQLGLKRRLHFLLNRHQTELSRPEVARPKRYTWPPGWLAGPHGRKPGLYFYWRLAKSLARYAARRLFSQSRPYQGRSRRGI